MKNVYFILSLITNKTGESTKKSVYEYNTFKDARAAAHAYFAANMRVEDMSNCLVMLVGNNGGIYENLHWEDEVVPAAAEETPVDETTEEVTE